MAPGSVVDRQIEAFNRRDADAVAATYAMDAVITNAMSGDPPIQGRPAIRDHYAAMFGAVPALQATVAGRLRVGNLIIDHEQLPILGAQAVATYEVEGELIQRAWLFGPLPT